MVLNPGTRTSKHHHPGEEVFYLLRGHAMFLGANDNIEMTEGDAVLVAAGEPHQVQNVSKSEACEILIALTPPREPSTVVYCD
jgi:quercetin dioxygenase-like cupin family protein